MYKGKCSIVWCNNEIEALGTWHVGHNKPWIDGGSNSVDNLFPLCCQCNLSMGTQTIDEFNNLYNNSQTKQKLKKFLCFTYLENN